MLWNLLNSDYHRYPLIHLLLLALLALYTLFGAFCFCSLEAPSERRLAEKRRQEWTLKRQLARQNFLKELRNSAAISRLSSVTTSAMENKTVNNNYQQQTAAILALDRYEEALLSELLKQTVATGKHSDEDPGFLLEATFVPKWTIWGGLYFAGTVYTTIGYGDIVAETSAGKVFTVFYALVGIPLVVALLNVWGGGLFQLVQFLWRKKSDNWKRCIFPKTILGGKKQKQHENPWINFEDEEGNVFAVESGEDQLQTTINFSNAFVESSNFTKSEEEKKKGDIISCHQQSQIPLKLAFFLLLGWVLLCAAVFSATHKSWSLLDVFYFLFVTLTTIGFGDYTVEHRVACAYFFFVLVGLTIVSMSINIIQHKIEHIFASILGSIDEDFKNDLLANALSTKTTSSTSTEPLGGTASATKIRFPNELSSPQQQQQQLPVEESATEHYARRMPRSERLLVRLMSTHQRNELDARLAQRRRMRNAFTQTVNFRQNSSAQTDVLKKLDMGALTQWDFQQKRGTIGSFSEEEEDETEGQRKRSKSTGTAIGKVRAVSSRARRMYIYNTGD